LIVLVGDSNLNPEIPGKIILGLECIREVSISEIRNHSGEIDQSVLFYMELLGEEIHSGGFSWKRYERIKNLAKGYAIHWIRYSFTDTNILLKECKDQFSYLTIFESENTIEDYSDLKRDFYLQRKPLFQNKAGNFIQRKRIPKILRSFRKTYHFSESLELKEFVG
jgi:hypothetical protein